MYGSYANKPGLRIETLDGGLNTKNSPVNIPVNQSPSAQNVTFDDFGAVGTRSGYALLNTAPIATAPIDGLISFINASGTAKLVAACAGSVWYCSGTTFITIPSAQSLFTAGTDMEFHAYDGRLFCSNGQVQPYKWNGTEFTRMGVSAPTQTLSAACTGAGTLNGVYRWVFTAVNSSLVESDYGGNSPQVTITNGQATVSNIPTAPMSHGINQWYMYRNSAAISNVFYRVTSVTNGVTSLVDPVADSLLGVDAPTDNMAPRKFKFMASLQGRLWGAGEEANPDFLWFSEVSRPELFSSANFIAVAKGNGQVISGLSVLNNAIVITKSDSQGQSSTYVLFLGDSTGVSSPTNWYLIKSDAAWGSESHRAIVPYSNVLSLLNRDGMFAFQGQDIALNPSDTQKGSLRVDAQSFDIEPDVFNLKKSLLSKAAGVRYKNKIWFSVAYGSSATSNNRVYQFDFVRASKSDRKTGAWIPFTGHNISQFAVHQGELYGGSSLSDGKVYKLDTGTSDAGTAIDSFFQTAAISGLKQHKNAVKTWRYAYILADTLGDWDVAVSYKTDFDGGDGTTELVPLDPDSSIIGTFVIGTGIIGPQVARKRYRVDLRGATGRYIQLKFRTNTIDQSWKVHEIELQYNLRGNR